MEAAADILEELLGEDGYFLNYEMGSDPDFPGIYLITKGYDLDPDKNETNETIKEKVADAVKHYNETYGRWVYDEEDLMDPEVQENIKDFFPIQVETTIKEPSEDVRGYLEHFFCEKFNNLKEVHIKIQKQGTGFEFSQIQKQE